MVYKLVKKNKYRFYYFNNNKVGVKIKNFFFFNEIVLYYNRKL